MLNLKIESKEYKLEFTLEASLCSECTEKVTGLMLTMAQAKDDEDMKKIVASLSDIPQTTLSMFYAGLLEHHGEDGDGSVITKADAKKLLKQYLTEHKDDEKGNFYAVMEMLIEQMGNDGFFKQIGLEQLTAQAQEAEKAQKVPQDHKKKATKVTEK